MNAPVTRRALLGATAAIGACALPALAEAGIPAGPDAELFAFLDRWEAITAGRPALEDALDAAMNRARDAYPPRPAALSATIFDQCTRFEVMPRGAERMPNGRLRCFWQHEEVEALRAGPPPMHFAAVADDHAGPVPEMVDPRGEARRQRLIAAHDEWMAEREAVDHATGYSALNDAWEAQIDALNAAERAVKLCAPRTLAGLVRKAAWVADLLARDAADEELAEVFARQVVAFAGAAA